MATTRTVCITFLDGQVLQFEFTPPEGSELETGSRFDHFVDSNFVSLDLDGSLLMYPMSTIRSIQVTPIPKPIPRGVIQGVKNVRRVD